MQAYALQQALRKLGYEPVTLDIPFVPAFWWYRADARLYEKALRLKHLGRVSDRVIQQQTDRFVAQHIHRSPRITSSAKLQRYYQQQPAHAYIVGSDQVWRQSFVPMLSDYFLGFIPERDNVRRIAYAASFGIDPIDIAPDQIPLYSMLLKRFDAVSVREISAVSLLEQQFDCPTAWTLDPTMLLTQEEYIAQLGLRQGDAGDVFAYFLSFTTSKEALAQQVAREHQTECRLFSPWRHGSHPKAQPKACILPPVEEWLEVILNAQYVVTDSFHGVAFSLIFGKPFVAIVNKSLGCSRFDTFVELFGLEVHEYEGYELVSLPDSYDREAVAQTLSTHRADSIAFLQRALG